MHNICENEITNMGGDFNYINCDCITEVGYVNLISQSASDWSNKSISATTGSETNSTIRLIPTNQVEVTPNKTYKFGISNSDFQFFNLHAYDTNGAWLGAREYFGLDSISGDTLVIFTIPANVKYIKPLIRKSDNGTIITSDIENSGIELSIHYISDN